jgi:hypothetical protein
MSDRACLLSIVVAILYIVACFKPAVHTQGSGSWFASRDYFGYEALLFGWMSPIPWSANLFLVAGWIAMVRNRLKGAVSLGLLAVLASLSTVLLGGLAGVRSGYYFWQASILTFASGILYLHWTSQGKRFGGGNGIGGSSVFRA